MMGGASGYKYQLWSSLQAAWLSSWLQGVDMAGAHDDFWGGATSRYEIAETKPPYVCPGCLTHTYNNNMINKCHIQ
jgi:hypothetical protein